MEWPHLIVALIVIAAYVIKHIVGTQQEAAAQRERAALKPEPQPAVVVKTDDDVARERTAQDRRAEEAVERRREREETGGEEKPAAAPVKRFIPMAGAGARIDTSRPGAVPRYQPPPAARDRSLPEVRRIPRSEVPPVVRLAPPKPADVPPLVRAGPRAKANVPAVAEIPQIVLSLPTPDTTASLSPAIREALDLLKNPRALATAFVLREILDRPVSLRRRRFAKDQ